jgi:hypothetical protein
MSLADLITWAFLAVLIGWLGFVLWCTYTVTLDEMRRAGVAGPAVGRGGLSGDPERQVADSDPRPDPEARSRQGPQA